ncbi:MAG TPA: hypothetical protein VNQ90_03800 [Chthoniobacteraceae bacterium]|nr:hypothetical protein [Chthoniobacteraceae bacterium]
MESSHELTGVEPVSGRKGDEEAAVASIAESAALWFATCATILTKDQQLVRPVPNLYQLRLLEAYEWCMKEALPCRILALKPRQKGSSTVSSAVVYHHCRRFRSRALQMADRYKNSDNLFAMTNRFAEYDDFPWASQWQATGSHAILQHQGKLWSRIEKDTAENPRAGRSGTLQVLHVSEAAHFPNEGEKSADKTMLSLLNSLADVAQSVAIIETTANGTGGWFYEHWLGAVDFEAFVAGRRGNGWIKIFAPWFSFDDSVHPLAPAEAEPLEASLNDREKRGRTVFGWTGEQIAWRRWTLAQKCAGREELFDQEYPETEESAFLTSGRPRFSTAALTRLHAMQAERTAVYGFLHHTTAGRGGEAVAFEAHEAGWAEIWEPPCEGRRYLLWCDTATGREQTRDSRDPDRHSILVLRQAYADPDGTSGHAMLVARVRPPCFDDWHVLEEKVIALSTYYGRCLIGVEVPMGLTLLEGLRRAGMPLFKRRPTGEGGVEKPGFQSNVATKPLVIASLSRSLDGDPPLDLHDPHTLSELSSFVVHEDGSEAALAGRHDDDVMSLAMAVHHLSCATPYRLPKAARPPQPADLHRWRPLHR